MTAAVRRALALALLAAAGAGGAPTAHPPAADAALSIWRDGAWHEWWHAARAPGRWAGTDPRVAGALEWRRLADGVEWAEARLAG